MKKYFLVLIYVFISACSTVDQPTLDTSAINNFGVANRLIFRDHRAFIPGAKAPFTGLFADYYPNGAKKSTINYTVGLRDGLTQEWYENGQPKIEMNYRQGVVHGFVLGWNKKGQKTLQLDHVNGKITPNLSNATQLYKLDRFDEAFPIYQELANRNVPKAQFILGYMYNNGQGTQKNDERAYFWYHKAAGLILHKTKHS